MFAHDRKSFQWTCDNSDLDFLSLLHAARMVGWSVNLGRAGVKSEQDAREEQSTYLCSVRCVYELSAEKWGERKYGGRRRGML